VKRSHTKAMKRLLSMMATKLPTGAVVNPPNWKKHSDEHRVKKCRYFPLLFEVLPFFIEILVPEN